MEDEKRLSPEEAGKLTDPERKPETVRRWCRSEGLQHTKDGPTKRILISRYSLRKFCKRYGIKLKGGAA